MNTVNKLLKEIAQILAKVSDVSEDVEESLRLHVRG